MHSIIRHVEMWSNTITADVVVVVVVRLEDGVSKYRGTAVSDAGGLICWNKVGYRRRQPNAVRVEGKRSGLWLEHR